MPRSAAGQSILINNAPFAVAGVAPPGFFGVDPAAAPDFYRSRCTPSWPPECRSGAAST